MTMPWQGQLMRFLLVGLANTVVGLGSIWVLIWLAGWNDVPANAAGYAMGLTSSFVLNRRWTFAHRGPWWTALWRFVLVFGVAYAANLACMLALRDGIGMDRYLAHAAATVPYTLLFFVGSRLFAFRPAGSSGESQTERAVQP